MDILRHQLIRLAYDHPDLRPKLLPILTKAATLSGYKLVTWFNSQIKGAMVKHGISEILVKGIGRTQREYHIVWEDPTQASKSRTEKFLKDAGFSFVSLRGGEDFVQSVYDDGFTTNYRTSVPYR